MTQSDGFSLEGLSPQEVLQALDTGWPWPLDAVQDWFEGLWNWVGEIPSRAIAGVTDFLSDTASTFWQLLVGWFSTLSSTVTSWVGWLEGRVVDTVSWLWDQVRPLVQEAVDLARSTLGTVSGAVGDTVGAIADTLQGWVSSLSGFFQQGVNYLGSYVNQVADWMGERLDAGVATIRAEIADPITDFFQDLPERIGAFFSPVIDFFRAVGGGLTWFFQGFTPEEYVRGWRNVFRFVQHEVGEQVQAFWEAILSWVRGFSPMSPAKSPSMAQGLLTLGSLSAGGLALMTLGGEMMHPLKQMGLGHISAIIGDVVNYRMISGVIMGALLTSGLRTPLNYYINALLRPWLLDRGDFMELMSRRAFTEPEVLMPPDHAARFREAIGGDGDAFVDSMLGYYGYPAEYRAIFEELANTRIGYFALAAVARDGTFDEEWFTESLHRAGYSERVVQRLLDMYRRTAQETVRGQFASAAFKRYREGLTDRATFRLELELLGYPPDKVDRFLVAGELDRETDVASDLVAAYRSAFRRGRLSVTDFRAGLRSLGITPERIDAYVEQERIWRGGELAPESEETLRGKYAGAAIRAYKEGFYTREQLHTTLSTLGYTPQEIAQLVLRGDLEYQLDFALDLVAAYREAYRRDLITEGDLRQRLTELGLAPERVEALVLRENVRKFPTR